MPLASNTMCPYVRLRLLASNSSFPTTHFGRLLFRKSTRKTDDNRGFLAAFLVSLTKCDKKKDVLVFNRSLLT